MGGTSSPWSSVRLVQAPTPASFLQEWLAPWVRMESEDGRLEWQKQKEWVFRADQKARSLQGCLRKKNSDRNDIALCSVSTLWAFIKNFPSSSSLSESRFIALWSRYSYCPDMETEEHKMGVWGGLFIYLFLGNILKLEKRWKQCSDF